MAQGARTIEDMVAEHGRMLVRLAVTRLDSVADAEDAVQDVFCTVMEKKLVFADPDHERAWLIRATINRACDLRRRAARRNLPLDEAQQVPDLSDEAVRRGREMLDNLRRLPEKYASALHLHYYEGYSLQEIGSLLGIPAATVGTRLARGRKRLQTLIEEDEK